MAKYLKTGKGIKLTTYWGESGEAVATYRRSGVRHFRIRLGPAHFTDLPRSKFEWAEPVIKFATIQKLFAASIW